MRNLTAAIIAVAGSACALGGLVLFHRGVLLIYHAGEVVTTTASLVMFGLMLVGMGAAGIAFVGFAQKDLV